MLSTSIDVKIKQPVPFLFHIISTLSACEKLFDATGLVSRLGYLKSRHIDGLPLVPRKYKAMCDVPITEIYVIDN